MSDDSTETTETEEVTETTTDATTADVEEFDKDRALATIKAQRESEKQLKAQLAEAKKAQDKLAEIEAAQLSDQEKAAQELEQAKRDAQAGREALRRGYLLAELAKSEHGIVDAEAAAALITGVEFGEDGKPTNATERIEALLDAKQFLKATETTTVKVPNVNGGSGTAGAAPPDLTPEQIAFAQKQGISPEKYAAWLNVSTATQAAQAAALLNPST